MPSVAYPEWKYRARVDITNATTTANYQHRLNLSWLPGMARDFSDIRFTDQAGNILSFWEENTSRVTGTSAVVWIKITTASTKTIYLYYGNGAATDASDGTNTFVFFDDFPGSSLDGAKWANGRQYGTTTVSGGICSIVGSDSNWQEQKSIATFGTGYVARWRVKHTAAANSYQFGFGYLDLSPSNQCICNYALSPLWYNIKAGSASSTAISENLHSDYNIIEIKRNSTTNVIYTVNNTGGATISTNVPTVATPLFFSAYKSTQIMYVDWVLVRQYTATEPTLTIGTHGPNPEFSRVAAAGMWIAAIVAATTGAATYIPNIMNHRRNQGMS